MEVGWRWDGGGMEVGWRWNGGGRLVEEVSERSDAGELEGERPLVNAKLEATTREFLTKKKIHGPVASLRLARYLT